MPFTDVQVEEEQAHFANVLSTFAHYAPYALNANNRRRKDIHTLPLADRELLDALGYKDRISAADHAILKNAEFLNLVIANPEIFGHDLDDGHEHALSPEEEGQEHPECHSHGDSHSHSHAHGSHSHSHSHGNVHPAGPRVTNGKKYRPSENDMDKLRSTLKQLVRDWSVEGKAERDVCYEPIKEALLRHFDDIPPEERRNFRVLVPGAGLGRLAWDVASLGFACQGNEFSHYMLLASFFMLNRTDAVNKYTIYPYVHSFSNIPNTDALLRAITIPDVLPTRVALPPSASRYGTNGPRTDAARSAGDFEEIYGDESNDGGDEPSAGKWDAVLTCFFIDTAKNVVNYLRIIHRMLAPGGVWINLGPLLWHWENNTTNDPSVELTLDEVKALARKVGFELSNERTVDTTYTNNAQSMLGYVYHAAFWTATKVV
ncbi:N2227-domain-containing protein [Daedaleopsis nitida]|nr:N2227-domain-containing protein [Daedaleopsis nitida]